jgi:sugar lactone lactonase YvrE
MSTSGLAFKPDGKKLFVAGDNDKLLQYDLGTAWDITSATNEQSYSTNFLQTAGIDLKGDGTKLFVGSRTDSKMNSYDLSSSWDITSAGNRQTYTFSDFSYVGDLNVTNSGQSLYVTDDDGLPSVWEYQLSTPWDISTISPVTSIVPSGTPSAVRGIFVRSDDSQIFVTDEGNGDIYQYDEDSFDGTIYASVQTE